MHPFTELDKLMSGATKVVVAGVGYEMGRDDAVGLEVARLLEERDDRIVPFQTHTAPENFIGAITRELPTHVIFVDGAKMGLQPGQIRIIDEEEIKDLSFSTHTLPLSIISSFIKKETGSEVIIIGIQPQDFGFSDKLTISKVARASAKKVADKILELVDQ